MTTGMQTVYSATSSDGFLRKYSSTTSSHSPRKQRRNVVQRMVDRVRLGYYRYEVTYGIYTMTTSEKIVANTFVVVVLSLFLWATLFYFPSLLYRKLTRLVWLLTGHSGEEMSVVWTAFDAHNETLSSSVSVSSARDF